MKSRKLFLSLLVAVSGLLVITAAYAKKQEFPEITVDGLHRVPDSKLAVVYAEPGASLAQYHRVKMLDAYVAFKKNWLRDQRSTSADPLRVKSSDVEKIKNTLAAEFQTVFTKALEDAGLRDKIKVMIGGSPTTPRFAQEIGADGFGFEGREGVELAWGWCSSTEG